MIRTVTEYLKYEFTDAELLVFAKQFALETQKKSAAEELQKEVVSQIKAEIAGHDKEVQRLSRFINQGYEYRNVECDVLFHEPEPRKKTIRRKDTGEMVKVLTMDESELQEFLPFEDVEPEPAPESTEARCTVSTGDGEVLFEGTTADIKKAARRLRAAAKANGPNFTHNGAPMHIPTDPNCAEWRTNEEIRDGVPRYLNANGTPGEERRR